MNRILCLRPPQFPVQRLLVARPELKGRAILLHARDPRRGERVVACCERAFACGVRVEMSLAEATALAKRGAKLSPQPYDPAADLRAWLELAEVCERFSPHVGLRTICGGIAVDRKREADPPEALFLDITGIGPLFGGEELLAREVLTECASRGFVARVGIAESVGSAWCATFSDLAAKQKFHLVPAGAALETLAELSIDTLRLPEDTLSLLNQLGVFRIDQLSALPRDGTARRLGELPLLRLDQLCGAAAETIVPHHPPPKFEAWQALEYPRRDTATIEWILAQLVERITTELQARGEGALELNLRLDCESSPLFVRIGLFRPTAAPKHLLELLRLRLESLRLPGMVGRIGLQAISTARLEQRQSELFPDDLRAATRDLAVLIDRLGCRLGAERVVWPELQADPLPERAYRATPLAGDTSRKRTSTITPPAPLDRPLEFFDPPSPVTAVAMEDGPPVSFVHRGEQRRIARQWGPERIETGWWRSRLLRRDYWRVETETGERFWLFRDLRHNTWFLAGVFA